MNKYAGLLAAAMAVIATPLDRSRRYSGPTQQDIDQARARDKRKKVREEIRVRKAMGVAK